MTDRGRGRRGEDKSGIGEKLDGPSGFVARGVDVGTVDPPGSGDAAVGLDAVVAGAGQRIITGGGQRLPGDVEPVAGANDPTLLNAAGDDELEVEPVGIVGGPEHGGAAEIPFGGVDAVDGVGAGQTVGGVDVGRKVAGERTGVEHDGRQSGGDDPFRGPHVVEPSPADDELIVPRWLKVVAALFTVLVLGAIAFAYFEPVQVLPRLRLAPGYALTDDQGGTYTSESARGVITVYTFAPVDCRADCDAIDATMAGVAAGVDGNPAFEGLTVRLVTVALGSATTEDLEAAARRSGADGERWRWIGGSDDEIRLVVGEGFRRYYAVRDDGSVDFDPAFVITDGAGIVRGEYRYRTRADDAAKLTSHLEILADEVRYSNGAAAVAYEAAHLFLCYP